MAKTAQPFLTPKAELSWVFITGEGTEDLNGNQKYKASLRFLKDSEEHKIIQDKIDKFWAENKPGTAKSMKSCGLTTEKVDGVETGYMLFTMQTATTFPDGKPKVISVHNAAGKKVSMGDKKIGNGSIGYLSGAIDIYTVPKTKQAGVTFYLNAIQLTKFVEFTGSTILATPEEGWTGEDEFADAAVAVDDNVAPIDLGDDDIPL